MASTPCQQSDNTRMNMPSRQSVRLGQPTTSLFDAGHCPHASIARRIDTVATRYAQILTATAAPNWNLASWITYLALARSVDLTHHGAPWAILGAAKAGAATKTLAYTLESAPIAQQFLLISLAERAPDTTEDAAITTFLADNGITPSA